MDAPDDTTGGSRPGPREDLRLDGELPRRVAEFAPYLRELLGRAAAEARRMHAEELTPEHVLTTLLGDEEAGATRLVLHAFADPEAIAAETLALCPGILVVGSGITLPFSPLSVRALERAPALRAAEDPRVEPRHVLVAAGAELAAEERQALAEAGAPPLERSAGNGADGPGNPIGDPVGDPVGDSGGGGLFRIYSDASRQALGRACRAAAGLGRRAIAPAHLIWGALEIEPASGAALTLARARMVLGGRDEDTTPCTAPAVAPDEALEALLGRLAAGAQTIDLLGDLLERGSEELRMLLSRQRITIELHRSAGGSFPDPS